MRLVSSFRFSLYRNLDVERSVFGAFCIPIGTFLLFELLITLKKNVV